MQPLKLSQICLAIEKQKDDGDQHPSHNPTIYIATKRGLLRPLTRYIVDGMGRLVFLMPEELEI